MKRLLLILLMCVSGSACFPGLAAAASLSHFSRVSCGSLAVADAKHEHPFEVRDIDSCLQMEALAESWIGDNQYNRAYDTIRHFIQYCYTKANPSRAFGDLRGAEDNAISTLTGCLELRQFLFTVLPLRNDDQWFCYCVLDMGGTFQRDTNYTKEGLAVLKFLIDNPRCAAERDDFGGGYAQTRKNQIHSWTFLTGDTNMKDFDSSLPSFHVMGLDSLLKYAASSGVHYEVLGPQIILGASLSPNPAHVRASLAFSIGREAYVHVDVYDLLGNKLSGIGYEGVFEPGERIVPLDLHALPSGTYYIHIATANNEVRTIKLVKE